MVTVRLYRPLPSAELAAALPATARRVAVLDRTKEPGAGGEPLYLDVVAALADHDRRAARSPATSLAATGSWTAPVPEPMSTTTRSASGAPA